jgi:hypothetical protein
MPSWLPDDLPNLTDANYRETSPSTPIYNCIAWAAGDDRRYWWPVGAYWPPNVPREETVPAFLQAFAAKGYIECADATLEPGVEKVALYADGDGVPSHAALQLEDGSWTSKLGALEDIAHETLEAVNCKEYGQAVRFLKRPRSA